MHALGHITPGGPGPVRAMIVQTLGNTPVKIACPKGAPIARVPGGTWAGLECQARAPSTGSV
jgi:hypothetical protein